LSSRCRRGRIQRDEVDAYRCLVDVAEGESRGTRDRRSADGTVTKTSTGSLMALYAQRDGPMLPRANADKRGAGERVERGDPTLSDIYPTPHISAPGVQVQS
jgi:hypothetical protein